MHDPMPLLIKKKSHNFWKDPRRGSNQGPHGPTNLESSVLLTELSQLMKSWGSNTIYIVQVYYIYILLGMNY